MAREYRQNTPYEEVAGGGTGTEPGGGGKPVPYDKSTGRYTDGSSGNGGSKKKSVNLSKQDWARIYQKLGEIKRGGSVIRTAKGDIVIPLHKMRDGDTVKLVFIGGTYEQPTMKSVFQFADEDDMNDFIEEIERGK